MNIENIVNLLQEANNNEEFNGYEIKAILSGFCYSAHQNTRYTEGNIADQVSQLRQMSMNFSGSEVEDTRMANKVEYIQKLEKQVEFFKNVFNVMNSALFEQTGETWKKPVKQSKEQAAARKQTLAALEANNILAKYTDAEGNAKHENQKVETRAVA